MQYYAVDSELFKYDQKKTGFQAWFFVVNELIYAGGMTTYAL